MNILKKIIIGVKLAFWRIGSGLVKTEEEILKPKDLTDADEKNKIQIRAESRNKFARILQQGKHDENFIKEYYELLNKADDFIEKADPEKIASVVDSRSMTMGKKLKANGSIAKKNEAGRRYDHYGFFDPKHKHYGKTIRDVTKAQVEERKLKDDDFPIEFMIKNTPSEVGFGTIAELPIQEQAKHFKFPINIIREGDSLNKIEQITESLHIKRIDDIHRILEFIIPEHFKLGVYDGNSKIVKELCNIQQVWHLGKYGERHGFLVTEFYKKIHIERYDVIKLKAKIIEKII